MRGRIQKHVFYGNTLGECAQFRWLRAIVGLMGVVSSCHRGSKIFSRGSQFFYRGYFVGLHFSSWVIISWVQDFLSRVIS